MLLDNDDFSALTGFCVFQSALHVAASTYHV